MDCRQLADSLYLRPEHPVERAALTAHLRECASCAAEAQRQARTDDLLRASLVTAPPADLSGRLAALVRGSRFEAQRSRSDRTSPASNLVPRTSNPERTSNIERRTRLAERLAVYAMVVVAGVVLGSQVGADQSAWLLSLGREVVFAIQVILASPILWLLPEPMAVAAWFAPALALLPLVWLLRPAEMRSRRQTPRRAKP